MKIDYELACQDGCLDVILPSDLRQLVCERDQAYRNIDILKAELDALRERVRWRDVRYELPEDHQTVIVFCKYDKEPTAAYINQGYWYEKHEYSIIQGDAWVDHTICKVGSDEYDAVTHWQLMSTTPTSIGNKD